MKNEVVKTYHCAHCGGTFDTDRPEDEAQAEAVALWGQRGDAPGMAELCDDCFREFMKWFEDRGYRFPGRQH